MASSAPSLRHFAWTTAAHAIVWTILAALAPTARAAPPLSFAAAEALQHAPATQRRLDALQTLIDTGDDLRIAGALATLEAADAATDPSSESTLYAGLLMLAEKSPGPAVRAAVGHLATRTPRLFVNHGEGTIRRAVPLFDSGAAARYAQRRWVAAQVAATARTNLRKGNAPTTVSGDKQASRDGLAAAIEDASVTELLRSRDALAAALIDDQTLARAALEAAVALRDADLLVAVVHHGQDRDALDALAVTSTLIDPAAAARVIDAGLAREATASRAVFALAERAREDPQARARLLALPGSPRHGESAAAALARLDDHALTRTLGEMLLDEADERRATHLALALRLSDHAEAHAALSRYANMPGAHPRLKARLRGVSL